MQTEREVSRPRAVLMLSAAALLLAVAAAPASAQRKPVVVKAAAPVSEAARMRANLLVVRAESFDVGKGEDDQYFTLARMYRTAADLRGVDTAAIMNYRMAAWAYNAGGDNTAAFRVMARAAELAERVDDVEGAIASYVDAALLAKAAGHTNHLAPLVRRADELLQSPSLSADRRTALLGRLEAEPAFAALLASR